MQLTVRRDRAATEKSNLKFNFFTVPRIIVQNVSKENSDEKALSLFTQQLLFQRTINAKSMLFKRWKDKRRKLPHKQQQERLHSPLDFPIHSGHR